MAIQLRHRQYRSKFDRRYNGGPGGPPPPDNPLWAKILKWVLIALLVGGVLLSYKLFS